MIRQSEWADGPELLRGWAMGVGACVLAAMAGLAGSPSSLFAQDGVAVEAEAQAVPDDQAEALRMPRVFGDHMVLQRGQALPVWGKAAAGESIAVTIAGQRAEAVANDAGDWSATLEPLTAGGPYRMEVSAGERSLAFEDVMVGEVWLVSGQSNMDMRLIKVDDAESEIAASANDRLRLFRVERAIAAEPAFDVDAEWAVSNPADARMFSAVGFFLGQALERELDVSVGIIHTAYGGTPVEAWTPLDALANNPETAPILQRQNRRDLAYAEALAAYEAALAADVQGGEGEPKIEVPNPPIEPPARYRSAGLYHAMLKPLAPYGIRGFAWYQGESNIWRAAQYEHTLTEMIHAWRTDWNNDALPFGVIQLPGLALPPRVPRAEGSWPELRESQLRVAQNLERVGLIVTTDLGDPTDIHPTAKRPVGERLARWALHTAYGHDVVPTGPILVDHRIEGDKIILTFDHVGEGLTSADGQRPNGFCVAGPDKKFRWATHIEILDERTMAIGEAKVPNPQAVRYGWDDYVPWATLTNSEGLPASPFRTDDWERITEHAR